MSLDNKSQLQHKENATTISAYSVLEGQAAQQYLKKAGLDSHQVHTVHLVTGQKSQVPENIRSYVPDSAENKLAYLIQHPNPKFQNREWYQTTVGDRSKIISHNLPTKINHDNLANMFTTNITVITESKDDKGREWNDETKKNVLSGRTYVDMFNTGVDVLFDNQIIDQEQKNNILAQKLEALQNNPTSIFNFRFDQSLPLGELRKLATSPDVGEKYPPTYISSLIQLIDQWDVAQSRAVTQIAQSQVNQVNIRGLLTDGTPQNIVEAATATAFGKKDDIEELAQFSREIPPDQIYEAVSNYTDLNPEDRQKVDQLVLAKKSWRSIKGEIAIHGQATEKTTTEIQSLLGILRLDSINMFTNQPGEREIMEQRLNSWVNLSSPDKRSHVESLKTILAQEKGIDALDMIHATAGYLFSISRQIGKSNQK